MLACLSMSARASHLARPQTLRRVGVVVIGGLALGPPACRCDDAGDAPRPGASACAERGTVYVSDRATKLASPSQVRAVHGGCEGCAQALRRGAPAAARCRAYQVCAEHCCRCPESERWFVAQACVEHACARPELACQAALAEFGRELCD